MEGLRMFKRFRSTTAEADRERPPLTISDEARRQLLAARSEDSRPFELALWVEVTGVEGDEYCHNMYFDLMRHAGPDDVVLHQDDLPVVIPKGSVEKLRGARITPAQDPRQGGWLIDNPNKPSPGVASASSPAVGMPVPQNLSGSLAERVRQVLDLQINPSIAAHGGHADLVAVEDETVFVRMSGGCQGCGMARVTLGQGIEVAIKQAIPEVSRVVDVTDHAAGTNPYFEPSKS